MYKRLSGEAESRNVQNRMYMSPEQRKETLLSETMDIAPEDQIIMFQTLVSAEKQAIDDIKKQYVNTDKWLKAPNGKDANLTEKQWLQVRTPSFKKWFGDWESIAIKNRIEASQEVELTSVDNLPQGIEKQSIGTIIKYVSTLIAQKEVKHSELGEIEINNTGINDSLRHGRNKYKINSLLKIDEIIKKGTLIHTQIDNGKVDSFVLATRLKGRNPSYAITVIKQKRDGRKYYDHNIILKNKLETAEQIQNGNTSEMLHPALKNLLQKIYSVNENSVSKVVDENGEPLVVYHGSNHWFKIFNEGKTNKTNVNTPENTIFTNDNKEIASSFHNYYCITFRKRKVGLAK